jgi:hypothetical protein
VLKLSIIAWFEINQAYIAAALCENKSRPELVCCGKCVLRKELRKADNAEQKSQKNTSEKQERTAQVHFVLPPIIAIPEGINLAALQLQHAIMPRHFNTNICLSIFHPPSLSYS